MKANANFFHVAVIRMIILAALAATLNAAAATDWTQAGANPQRTNFTPDSPAPPYTLLWRADFDPEGIYSAQPIVVDGRLFATTLNGNLYALDLDTGKRLWHFKAGEVVWGAAAAGNEKLGGKGLVFCASWDGAIHALNAADGGTAWRYDAGERISASPCLADNTLFIGTRNGRMLALGMDGKLKWGAQMPWQIFGCASFDAGRLYVPTEDMRIHCLDARDGGTIWTSDQIHGFTFRDFYPVLHAGRILLSTAPTIYRREVGAPDEFCGWAGQVPPGLLDKYTKPLTDKTGPESPRTSTMANGQRIPPEIEENLLKLPAYYEANPLAQSFFVLDQSDGKQAYHAIHHFSGGGLESLPPPPAVCHDGTVAVPCFVAQARVARLDIEKNRWVDILFERTGTNNDNSEMLAVGGTRIFSHNWFCGFVSVDITTRETGGFSIGAGSKSAEEERVSALPPERAEYRAALPAEGNKYKGIKCMERVGFTSGTFPPVVYGDLVFLVAGGHSGHKALLCFKGAGK